MGCTDLGVQCLPGEMYLLLFIDCNITVYTSPALSVDIHGDSIGGVRLLHYLQKGVGHYFLWLLPVHDHYV